MTLLKSIVVCLVLANVAYLLWARGIAAAPEEPARLAPAALTLASESGQASRAVNGAADGAAVGTSGGAPSAVGVGLAAATEGSAEGRLAGVKRCITVGPFRDVSDAARAASTLRGGGYEPRQRVADGDVYWIDIDLKPTDNGLNPADLQGGSGRIVRLEVKGCPSNSGAAP